MIYLSWISGGNAFVHDYSESAGGIMAATNDVAELIEDGVRFMTISVSGDE